MINKIHLERIKIYAYHGVLPEEKKIGSYYLINIDLETNFLKACKNDTLQDTINYDKINNIIHSEMKISSKLLENVAYRIIKSIFQYSIKIENINIKISKLNPPVSGEVFSCSAELNIKKGEI